MFSNKKSNQNDDDTTDSDAEVDELYLNQYVYSVFSKEEEGELLENAFHIIETYILQNGLVFNLPNYQEIIIDDTLEIFKAQFKDIYEDDITEELTEIIHNAFKLIHQHVCPKRSFKRTFIRKPPNMEVINKKLDYLRSKHQPEQKSNAWYEYRHNLLTASSIWKAFSSDSNKNSLIYDKCKPFNIEKYNMVGTDSPLHWGHKYEPLSVMYYEMKYKTKIEDFGCIVHDKFKFIAASPDGINNDPSSQRYGRMLEIKNIVNREINGIPKIEYWIQMQMQMEVCNLNECDFLETRFVEYEQKEDFDNDGEFNWSASNKLKGLIMYFIKDEKPFYIYAPLLMNATDCDNWQEQTMLNHQELTWVKNIYWKLEEVSCVLVLRNQLWFNHAVSVFENIWETINKEKVNGYEHRAPNKRIKKTFEDKPPSNLITDYMSVPLTQQTIPIKDKKKITVKKIKKHKEDEIEITPDKGTCYIDINELLSKTDENIEVTQVIETKSIL
jgi:putative phage-type endonuclease